MNDKLFRTLLKKYDAVIEDSLFKIDIINEQLLVIPEHIDITGEVDKLLQIVSIKATLWQKKGRENYTVINMSQSVA